MSEEQIDPVIQDAVENIANRFGTQGLCDLIALAIGAGVGAINYALIRLLRIPPIIATLSSSSMNPNSRVFQSTISSARRERWTASSVRSSSWGASRVKSRTMS